MCVCVRAKFQCKLYYESQFLKSEGYYSKLSVQVCGGFLGWVLKPEKKKRRSSWNTKAFHSPHKLRWVWQLWLPNSLPPPQPYIP